ncbi:hypothetical protein M0812_19895 [Anaeramoeba flamelloides]|uniref:DUF4185 domain-containing protein n=1 Tax=Anaeramoeba flamelloides TaxID=1746091 RepID=A0AAV7YX59_9EUKA|nr:hypothetical protein M0812_19895 [Anaeramoeba flamelloides]
MKSKALKQFLSDYLYSVHVVSVVICVGYWVVFLPMESQLNEYGYNITNPVPPFGWYYFLKTIMINIIPLLTLGVRVGSYQVAKYRFFMNFLAPGIFCMVYLWFTLIYWLFTRNFCYSVEYAFFPPYFVFAVLIYYFFMALVSLIVWAVCRRVARKRNWNLNDLENMLSDDEMESQQSSDQQQPLVDKSHIERNAQGFQRRYVPYWRIFLVLFLIFLIMTLVGIFVGLAKIKSDPLSKEKTTISTVTDGIIAEVNDKISQSGAENFKTRAVVPLGDDPAKDGALWLAGSVDLKNGWWLNQAAIKVTFPDDSYEIQIHTDDDGNMQKLIHLNDTENGKYLGISPASGVWNDGNTVMYFEWWQWEDNKLWKDHTRPIGLVEGAGSSMNFSRLVQPQFSFPIEPILVLAHDDHFYSWFLHRPTVGSMNLYLARIKKEDLTSPEQEYEFWVGSGNWKKKISKQNVPPNLLGIIKQPAIMYNDYLKSWLMVHVGVLGLNAKLYLRTSQNIYGPWGTPFEIIHEDQNAFSLEYTIHNLVFHPELAEENGKTVYLSYCWEDDKSSIMKKIAFEKK